MRGLILGVAGVSLAVAAVTANAEPAKPSTEVFFEFDSAQLSREAKDQLNAAAKEAKASPSARVVIDAHTDPVGTAPYNVALSIRRAEACRVPVKLGSPAAPAPCSGSQTYPAWRVMSWLSESVLRRYRRRAALIRPPSKPATIFSFQDRSPWILSQGSSSPAMCSRKRGRP